MSFANSIGRIAAGVAYRSLMRIGLDQVNGIPALRRQRRVS